MVKTESKASAATWAQITDIVKEYVGKALGGA